MRQSTSKSGFNLPFGQRKPRMRRSGREIKDKAEFIEILERADACHLALVDGAEPYLVTLNYGFSWHGSLPVLYFHCANAGLKLDIIRKNPQACFGVDIDHEIVRGENSCDWGMKYRSVVGRGKSV